MILRAATLFILLAFGWSATAAPTADRIALVIGMADYASLPKLRNTVNDARAISQTLSGIGFEVTTLIDSPRAAVERELTDFAFRAETADLALIYYAGHGVEAQGKNFLIPADATIRTNADVVSQSILLDDFLAAVDRARKMRVVILDSCRDNPLPGKIDLNSLEMAELVGTVATRGIAVGGRSTGGGLAAPSPDRGTLVAFAARDGQVALDGTGANSPFATALMEKMREPGLEIQLMFRQVRDEVLDATQNLQEPNTYGSLSGVPFYIAGTESQREEAAATDKAQAWSSLRPGETEQLQALATSGDARAMFGLAMIQLNPASTRYDPGASAALLARAAAAESPEAEYELAKLYERGIGVPENLSRALDLYRSAAAKDFPDAVNDLGYFSYTGALGLPIDQNAAVTLFTHAADLGQPEAMVNVASFIDKGLIPGRSHDDAAAYLYGALRGGSADALDALIGQPGYFTTATWSALQRKLADNGFYSGGADGRPGPGTRKAMRAAFGLLKTGD